MKRIPVKPFCCIPLFLIIFLLVSIACAPFAAEAVEVEGKITASVVWDRSHSPYSLTGDVRIGGITNKTRIVELKIEPGVEVKLNGFKINAGDAAEKGGEGYKGRVIADQAKFVGRGGIELLSGDENLISDSSFDRVNLVLGKNSNTVSSGSIQNITMTNANIIVQGGNWKIAGGKIINGSITHKNSGIPALDGKTARFLKFFVDMATSP